MILQDVSWAIEKSSTHLDAKSPLRIKAHGL